MRQHANACRAIRPNCVAGEHLPDKDAVSRQRMPRSLQPADRVDAQNRRPELPSGALCQADQSPALPSCASFLPWKDMLSISFPRLAGKPILVLWLCLAHQHPACTHRHVEPSCPCVRSRMDRAPSCFGEERLLRKAAVRATYEPPQEQKQGGASAPPCPYSLVLCRHIRPACPVCYPWVARVWARLWNFSLSTTTRSWVPSPMGPASS